MQTARQRREHHEVVEGLTGSVRKSLTRLMQLRCGGRSDGSTFAFPNMIAANMMPVALKHGGL